MTDIIPFPKTGERYRRELNEALGEEDYFKAYDLLYELERYVELSETEQLLKLEILKNIGSYVELREESSILLNQGHSDYPAVVSYFLQSLIELQQYQTVIELIDSLRTEAVDQRLLLRLAPLYDTAEKLKAIRDKDHDALMRDFIQQSRDEQIMILSTLLKQRNYSYRRTMLLYIQHTSDVLLQNMMLEYLMEAESVEIITIERNGSSRQVKMAELLPMDQSAFAVQVIPVVIDWFETHTSLAEQAETMMRHHLFQLYPFEFDASPALVAESYILYLSAVFNMEDQVDFKETTVHIQLLEQINQLNAQLM